MPELDKAYPGFIKLDRNAATLTFGFNGETVVHNITTSINATQPFHGVRARTSDGSKVVAWADDLSFAENPVPLADSSNLLATDTSSSNTGGNEGTGNNSNTSSSGGDSSGGGAFSLTVLFAGLLTLISKAIRRHRKLGIVHLFYNKTSCGLATG